MSAVEAQVIHRDHSGGLLQVFKPVGDSLTYNFKASDVGGIGYQIAQSDLLFPDTFAPYRTDYELQFRYAGGSWTPVQAGIHVPVEMAANSGVVQVGGKDWLHYLEQPWFFDPYNVDADDLTTGLAAVLLDQFDLTTAFCQFYPIDSQVQTVLTDMVVSGPPASIGYTTSFVGSGWGALPINFPPIMFQDQTNIIDHIRSLSSMFDPYGFDFYVDWDKKIYFYKPRRNPTTPIYTLVDNTTIVDIPSWRNNGPLATHVVGLGPGSPAWWAHKKDQDNINVFRHWLRLEQLGDAIRRKNAARLLREVKSSTDDLQFLFPHKDLQLTIKPELLNIINPLDMYKNHIGDVIDVDYSGFLPYHRIDAKFWIIGQDFHNDSSGNWLCDLTLQQVYE